MKGTNRSWRAQKGSKVEYAIDRVSGRGTITKILGTLGVPGSLSRTFEVTDDKSGSVVVVSEDQVRFSKGG